MSEALARYRAKRNFAATPEPQGGNPSGVAQRYSVQMHDATRLHWDLRLEWRGVLLSWAVTRGPSLNPADKRLAVRTEDHPFDYLTFEGTIPEGNYGAGTVMLWDIGWWQPFHDVGDGLAGGHLHFALHGRRATGGWSLVRLKDRPGEQGGKRGGGRENWLMVKDNDDAARKDVADFATSHQTSVASARSLPQIAAGGPAQPTGPARKGAVPPFRPVQLAETVAAPPAGEGWLHEVKLDGYRAQMAIGKAGVRVRTRSGADWSDRFAELVPPLAELPCDSALIDGEIMAGAGLDGFAALQAAIKAGGPFRFYAFDLLRLDGKDLEPLPLKDRRAALEKLLLGQPVRGILQLSPAIAGSAAVAFGAIAEAGGEGLVSKLADAPYRGGRSGAWVKAKCIRRDEFVILGWQPSPHRMRPFASLLLGARQGHGFVYRGKVGTGWDGDAMDQIADRLKPLSTDTPPIDPPSEARGARWVRPQLVAEIAYAEQTPGGILRHARFVALRDDKPAREVAEMPKKPAAKKDDTAIKVAGARVTSPDRLVFPAARITKRDVATWYADMSDRILPTLAGRPVSLVRLPDGLAGERFFQKHATAGFPPAIRRVCVPDKDGQGSEDWMTVTSAGALVSAVQMGTVEFHPWGARADKPDRPERLVFDLDPDEGLGWPETRAAAFTLRDRLADLGLPSWSMLSGGKGVHVIVPLRRTVGWDTAKTFAQLFAALLAGDEPNRFTAKLAKAARGGKIFVDWLRNERGATAVAPFTLRARPKATVAMPVSWDELGTATGADAWTMDAARERSWDDLTLPAPATLDARVLERIAAVAG